MQGGFELFTQAVNPLKARIVARLVVFGPWVAQSNKEFDHDAFDCKSGRGPGMK